MSENIGTGMEGTSKVIPLAAFRALDPELPGLAARAAFQLDNLRLRAEGKTIPEPKRDAIAKFAKQLQRALTIPAPAGDRRALLDPLTTSILQSALAQAATKPTSLDDMLKELGKLTEQLIGTDSFDQQVAGLIALRNFCIIVSDLASSKQRLIRSPRPSAPKASRL